MAPGLQIVLSGTLSFGVPLACAVIELVRLRRGRGGGNFGRRRTPAPPPPPPRPYAPGRLPPELIPSLPPDPVRPPVPREIRVREPELV